jgi:hypothetical protein
VASAAWTYLTELALLDDRNKFLAKINDEGKTRRSADSEILGKANVMSYEDPEEARAARAVKDAKAAVREARKTAKAAKDVEGPPPKAKEAAAAKTTRDRKRRSVASTKSQKAKMARISGTRVAEGEHEVSAKEPKTKDVRFMVTHATDGTAIERWKAPVARMWQRRMRTDIRELSIAHMKMPSDLQIE